MKKVPGTFMPFRYDIAWVLLVASVGAVPVLRGGVDEQTAVLLAITAALAFFAEHAWLTGGGEPGSAHVRMPSSLLPLLGACVWQTLLLVPTSVHESELRAFVWQALADPPRYAPIAVNPGALAIDVVRLWSIFLLALVVVHRTSRGRTNLGLFWMIAGSGAFQIVLGLYRYASEGEGILRASFVNPNHQAASFNLTWLAALAVALMSRKSSSRALAMTIASAGMGATILTLSRAGIASGVAGAAIFIALMRPRSGRRSRVTLALSIAIFGAALASYVMLGSLGARFSGRAEEKTRIWRDAATLALDYPLGTGRTGFGLAFERVRPPDLEGGRFDYVENEYLQTLTDYGPYLGAIGLAAWAWLVFRIVHYARKATPGGLRSPRRATVAASVVTLSLHAIFDFNWEILGVALPVWLMIASLGRPGEPPFAPSAFSSRAASARVVALVAGVIIVCTSLYGLEHSPRRLDHLATNGAADTRRAALSDLVRTRPLDAWAIVGLGEDAIARKDAAAALRWLNRAVQVTPGWAEPHISLARLFCAAKQPVQAHLEARMAFERLRTGEARVLSLLSRCAPAPMADAFPNEAAWTQAIVWALDSHEDAFAALLATDYTGRAPEALAKLAAFSRRRGDASQREKWLAAFADPEHPLRLAEIAEEALAAGRTDEAIAALEKAATTPALRLRLVHALIAGNALDRAEQALAPLADQCAGDRKAAGCRSYRLARAAVAMKRARHLDALEQYKTVLLSAPDDVEAALLAARALEAMDQKDEAIAILRRSERLSGSAAVRAERERLER
ncbi:MAG: O-antigen ligase family protein [Deltaproteobacteria bacterium]|nr:O-antigen ligase family protein [Deltaproteobacteria bacterium]